MSVPPGRPRGTGFWDVLEDIRKRSSAYFDPARELLDALQLTQARHSPCGWLRGGATIGGISLGTTLLILVSMFTGVLQDYLGWPMSVLRTRIMLGSLCVGCLIGIAGCVMGVLARRREQVRVLGPLSLCLAPVFALTALLDLFGALIAGMGHGRPYRVAGKPTQARARPGGRWSSSASIDTIDLTADERAVLAQSYLRAGLAEHASIASLAQLSLELMALGAPPALLSRCHEAALDEVRHAQVCFTIASRYAGRALEPGELPQASSPPPHATLEAVAAASLLDGWLNESIAAGVLAEMAAQCTDMRMGQALARMAEDERKHAALGRDIVLFCLEVGGARVGRALAVALECADATSWGRSAPVGLADGLASHGLLTRGQIVQLATRESDAVRAALGGRPGPRSREVQPALGMSAA